VSLSVEIENRLRHSFQVEQEFGGPQNYAALRVFGEIMKRLDASTGRRWADDLWTFVQFEHAIAHTLHGWRPEGELFKPTVPRLSPDTVDRLGRHMAENVLVQLDFTESDGKDDFAKIKRDLGSLNRGGAI